MRGLSDEEREMLLTHAGQYCGCTCPEVTGDQAVRMPVAIGLETRGLFAGWKRCAAGFRKLHPIMTPLGRLALACDAAARGMEVERG